MGRLSLLLPLLCAATCCVNAHPYSKIPDSVQFGEGFTSKKSSSNSLSSSSSHAGGSSYSSASASGAIPIGLVSGSAAGDSQISYGVLHNSGAGFANHGSSAGYNGNAQDSNGQQVEIKNDGGQNAGSQFWWMGPNSPFLGNTKQSGGCTANGCLATTTFESKIKPHANPFLHGGSSNFGGSSVGGSSHGGSASSGSSSFGSKAASSNAAQGTKNPFLNGAGFTANGNSAGGQGSVGSSADTRTNLVGGGNSFVNTGYSGSKFGQVPQIPSVSGGSGNPFFRPQAPKVPQFPKYPQVPQNSQGSQVSQGQENIYDDQQVGGFPSYPLPNVNQQPNQKANEDNPLSVTCSGEGHICVPYYLCSVDGYVINNSITQVRSGPQVCDLNNEVCCILKSTDQTSAGSANGGIFGNGNINKKQPDLTSGEDGNSGRLPGKTNDQSESNGYLPPIGSAPSSNVPAFTNPPEDEEKSGGSNSPVSIFPPAPAPPPQVGCAAALICVEDQFCTLGGVITTEPLSFTSEQLIRRVPLSTCKNPDNGIIGKCCRDPNYVDPWPAGNLPANYSGGFDEQGFPTILNLSKKRPDKKQPYNGGASKSGRPATKTPIAAPNRPQFAPNNFPRPVEIPQTIPTYNQAAQSPTPNVLPNAQNPFNKNSYDTSSTNQNPAPRPQPQFVSNNFPRPVEAPHAIPTYNQAAKSPTPIVLPNAHNPFNKNSYDTSSTNQNSGSRPQPQFVSNNFQRPAEIPQEIPAYNQAAKSPTPIVLPNAQNPFNKNSYDTSSTNQNPAPRPQPQFVTNNFPRPVEAPHAIPSYNQAVQSPAPFALPKTQNPFNKNNYDTSSTNQNSAPRPQPQFVTNNFPRPVEAPQAIPSYNQAVKSPAPFALPKTQNPFNKNSYDTSSTNQNPAIIAHHVPGSHCGLRNKVLRPNGLSDVDVAFGEITWQAMVLSTSDKKLLCSGAIIAPNAVVTAARCVEGFNPSEVAIKSGEWKLGYELKHEEPLPFEIINVASIAPYPAFSSGNPANDIAILFLEHDMKLDQHVDVLCLPEGKPTAPQPGRKCIATGWGKTVLQVNVAGSLMHSLDVDVLGNEQCLQRISGAETQIPLDDSLVCAKAHKQNNNMCQVDFGGPLACDRGDGYYELAGIYNQDTGCLPTNQVATFATIPTPWINKMMSNTPKYTSNEYQSSTNVGRNPFVHNHGSKEVCNCREHELLPAGSSQYLPPV